MIELTGKRFGKLTVVEMHVARTKWKSIRWTCICDCGKTKDIDGAMLRSGNTKSCGCEKNNGTKRRLDVCGERFGRLVAIKRNDKKSSEMKKVNRAKSYWECKCDCGNTVNVELYNLKSGVVSSCGCLRSENSVIMRTTHGLSKSRLYRIFHMMKRRCYKPRCKAFPDYGGKGVVVCRLWLSNFSSFYSWSLSQGYSDDLTIDRINPYGPYAPWNCQFMTLIENIKKMHRQKGTLFIP